MAQAGEQLPARRPAALVGPCGDTRRLGGWQGEQDRQRTNAWSPEQAILNSTGARAPEHTFRQPVPIVARIVWADDGEEYIETVASARASRTCTLRLPDRRWRLTSVWLDAADVTRR